MSTDKFTAKLLSIEDGLVYQGRVEDFWLQFQLNSGEIISVFDYEHKLEDYKIGRLYSLSVWSVWVQVAYDPTKYSFLCKVLKVNKGLKFYNEEIVIYVPYDYIRIDIDINSKSLFYFGRFGLYECDILD